ncbi:MAG TPA: hypothetical protein VNQ80_06760 [Parapedobacter sp.]|uniref:hypothetical protein n=1 Tax=Parapedobacter sp. TaxID=1958893 RepID=UPI002B5222CC|nr:hypothetical protein [Parapedobacter sp.]HWK57017.1 hypothetical protein [Parapedobacter sp.]
MDDSRTPWLRQLSRILLAFFMVATGIGHLTFLRQEFQAQVPRRVPLDTDAKRLARLFFQPVLVVWALWSSGAWSYLRRRTISNMNRTERK